jgi:hypothetical protein
LIGHDIIASDFNYGKRPEMNVSSKSPLTSEADSKSVSAVLEDWYRRVRINIDTHNYAERLYDRRNTVLAIINICSIVTVAVLASSVSISSAGMKVLVLALALLSAIASCLQLQLSYSEKAAANRLAARQYGALRRAIEMASELPDHSQERTWRQREIQRQWDFAASSAPNVPERIRMQAKRQRRERGCI